MGSQVAKALVGAGLAELIVASRTYERAVETAAAFAGTAIAMDRVDEYLARADIVIAASGAPRPIVLLEPVRRALKVRRYHPLFLVDLSVPRNIDPAVGGLEEAYLFNIDDLTRVVEQGQQARAEASAAASQLVEAEADHFFHVLRELEAGPSIGRLTRRVEELRAQELARSHRLVDALDPVQVEQLDAMTRALVRKILDGPIRAIRDAARDGDGDRLRALLDPWEEEDPP
jgi:glutamyl-tRNA reductase